MLISYNQGQIINHYLTINKLKKTTIHHRLG